MRFSTSFFPESNPSGTLINRLKWFFVKISFYEDIRFFFAKLANFKKLTKMLGFVAIVQIYF